MWERFTPSSRILILRTQNEAMKSRCSAIAPAHMFLSALIDVEKPETIESIVWRHTGWSLGEARRLAQNSLRPDSHFDPLAEPKMDAGAKRILELSADEVWRTDDKTVAPIHLLIGAIRFPAQPDHSLRDALAPLSLDFNVLKAAYLKLRLP